ncbi:elongation factor G-1, mitochondrial [Tanacetum coccineum]
MQSSINIIDTPGHVDFTIEVERALRVLDGAILVLCSVGGVQSQSITVDRQMKRYQVPRVAFINKLDRMGADPWKVLNQTRKKLRHHSAAVQMPIGLEEDFQGLVDLVQLKAYYFRGSNGENVVTEEIPADMQAMAAEKRRELIEAVSDVDDQLAEAFLSDEPISSADLDAAIRRATIERKFIPVFMGSAFKNKGVQTLLDGVLRYLPCPLEVDNFALDQSKEEEEVKLDGTPAGHMVALAFKLEERPFGQLTYLRIYEGVLKKGEFITNINTGKKIKISKLAGLHSYSMEFSKALNRFQREDPTFRVGLDKESGQTIISGMGELHLEVYVDATVGKPRVNFRETITQRAEFDYLHKKQSGGQGQYGRVCGYMEPLPAGSDTKFEFENNIIGQAIPSNFIPHIEKGFKEAANSGSLIGFPVENIRVVITDGASHAVDSSELAFRLASIYAFRQCYTKCKPVILEPVMSVEVRVPMEFQGTVAGDLNRGKFNVVPLNNMFGYSTALRSMTQGKGEFTMEYKEHSPVSADVQTQLINAHKPKNAE